MFAFLLVVALVVASSPTSTAAIQGFEEQLLLKPMPDGHVLAHFTFEMSQSNAAHQDNFVLFPKPIGQIISRFGVGEMSLSLSQGRWRREQWGKAPRPAPPGAELHARFNLHHKQSVLDRWNELQESVGGLLCASLHQIGLAAMPRLGFAVASDAQDMSGSNSSTGFGGWMQGNEQYSDMMYGSLPREAVCTENTTPFTKLLPCNRRAGLARLLHLLTLHDSSFHSMGLDVTSTNAKALTLSLSIAAVLDPVYLTQVAEWSLSSLFGSKGASGCVLSDRSSVVLELSRTILGGLGVSARQDLLHFDPSKGLNLASLSHSHQPTQVAETDHGFRVWFDLKTGDEFSLSFAPPKLTLDTLKHGSGVSVHVRRHLTGSGLQWGGMALELVNVADHQQRLTYFHSLPYYLRIYYHTLQHSLKPQTSQSPIVHLRESGSVWRGRYSELELEAIVPPRSTLSLHFRFEKSFLCITDYPPDVARGFDLPAGIVSVLDEKRRVVDRIYTDVLLVVLPGPDMSMPFNVIAFTSTLLAFFFGSLFNSMYLPPSELSKRVRGRNLLRLVRFLRSKLDKLRRHKNSPQELEKKAQ